MNEKYLLSTTAILGFLAVAIGAFAAHALKGKLDAYSLDVLQKGWDYHALHTGVLLFVVAAQKIELIPSPAAGRIALGFILGILIFSGSLYVLAVTGIKWLGAITPIGGTLFLVSWGYLAYCAFLLKSSSY